MEASMKIARQYFYDTKQPQRKNFIARQLSFHGNTLATLALAHHPGRRAPYADILHDSNFHHVSPAYAKRFQRPDETEEQYVERLRQELEDKFIELGPDTVIACTFSVYSTRAPLLNANFLSVVAETVVGATTGVVGPPKGYFKAVKSVCEKYGAFLILDEVMSGMGRESSVLPSGSPSLIQLVVGLGTLHAWEQFGDGVVPDLQAIAKGLGGG